MTFPDVGLAPIARSALAGLEDWVVPYGPAGHHGSGVPVAELCRQALATPVGSPSLLERARTAHRVAVIISDASRDEPRDEMLSAVRSCLPPGARIKLVIASGTHAPSDEAVPAGHRDLELLVHDARRSDLVEVGVSRRGTRARLLAELVESDLVVVCGRLRPHYFAGYSGGAKSVFPGCGGHEDILQNHLLKAHPDSALGRVEANPCRDDLEEVALMLPQAPFLLNVLCDAQGVAVAASAGHLTAAHRALARRAEPLFTVRLPRRFPVVLATDQAPACSTLYQASKLLPPAAAVLAEGGTVIMLADCERGTGPLQRVNEGIYRLGMVPRLPRDHRVLLASRLEPSEVAATYAEPVGSLREELSRLGVGPRSPAPLLCRATELITVSDAP